MLRKILWTVFMVLLIAGMLNPLAMAFNYNIQDMSLGNKLGSDAIQTVMESSKLNLAPEMNSISSQTANEGKTFTLAVSGKSNGVGSTLTYEAKQTKSILNPNVKDVDYSFNKNTGKFTLSPTYDWVKHPSTQKELTFQFRAFDGLKYSAWEYVTITVKDTNQKPYWASAAQAINAPAAPEAGSSVLFTSGKAQDKDGDVLTYTWNFGDGSSIVGETAKHAYTKEGTYTVTLKVRDGYDGEVSATKIMIVGVDKNTAPVINEVKWDKGLSAGNTLSEGKVASFRLSASDADGDKLAFQGTFQGTQLFPNYVTFDSVTGEVSINPGYGVIEHTHADLKETIKLSFRAYDGKAYSGWKSVDITILDANQNPKLLGHASIPKSANANQELTFSASAVDADGDELTYSWNFGDGTTVSGKEAKHAYTADGQYTVTLTVSDNLGGKASVKEDVNVGTVIAPPVIDTDGDGIADATDNCPTMANADQKDTDGDGIGDACEAVVPPTTTDFDGDGILNANDNCQTMANPTQTDTDGDKLGDVCDSSPLTPQTPTDTYTTKYQELQDKYEEYDDDYADYKKKYQNAKEDNDKKDLNKYSDKLNDLDDDLKDLEDDVDDLVDEVEDASGDHKQVLNDLEDLQDDIQKLQDKIDELLTGKSNSNTLTPTVASTFVPQTTAAKADSGIVVEKLNFTPPAQKTIEPVQSTQDWDKIMKFVWLGAGIVVLVAVVLFLLALLMRR